MDDELLPPPPAYSEQEFDQKTSSALELSLAAHRPSAQPEDEEWEEWSEAAFEAAAVQAPSQKGNGQAANQTGTSSQYHGTQSTERGGNGTSSTLPIEPLRIHKRGKSGSGRGSKPRPSWYNEAGLGKPSCERVGSSTSSRPPADCDTSSDLGHSWSGSGTRHEIPPDDEEDRSIPPPSFTSLGPPMDGVVRMAYHPTESTPPSPLLSPAQAHRPLLSPESPQQARPPSQTYAGSYPDQSNNSYPSFQRSPRQSLPAPSRSPNYHLGPRPVSSIVSSPMQNPVPRMDFNPSVAYTKRGGQGVIQHQPQQSFHASAFYNSAVSSHVSAPMTMQPRPSHSMSQQRPPITYHTQDHQPRGFPGVMSPNRSGAWPPAMTQPSYSIPPQQSMNASHFPQYPTYTQQSSYSSDTTPRWATSEEQFTRNFQ